MMKTLLIAIGVLLLTVSGSQALEVTFKPTAEVSGDAITLGEIAALSDTSDLAATLAAQIIGSAPEPGQTLDLDARQIINRLVKQNAVLRQVLWQGSATISVSRSFVTVGSREILAAIDDYLLAHRHQLPAAKVRFIPQEPPLPINLPEGELSWQVIPSSPSIIGSSRFSLIYKVDNRVRRNFSVLGRTEAVAPVVVAAKTLKYGDIITAEQIGMEERDLAQLTNPTSAPELVIGSLVKRTIHSGTAIDTTAIEQPPLVRKGEPVKIYVTHKRMVLTATGVARADGRKDEMIRVQNSSSNKLIYCRVEAPGIVEVTL